MSKACKSNELFFFGSSVSGKRERNTLVTHPELVNNLWKRKLIHDIDEMTTVVSLKAPAARERPMHYQLVGEVTAHQGYDGYRARERGPAHWD
jgi:hypothetical protein